MAGGMFEVELLRDSGSPRRARHQLGAWFAQSVDSENPESATLLVSELVTLLRRTRSLA
jgi:hypothetical protein